MECSNGFQAVPVPVLPTRPPRFPLTPARHAISGQCRLLGRRFPGCFREVQGSDRRGPVEPRAVRATSTESLGLSLFPACLMSLLFLTYTLTFTIALTLQLLERVRVAAVSGRPRSGARVCHPVYREEPGVRQGIYASGRGAAGPWAIRRGRGSVQQGARA